MVCYNGKKLHIPVIKFPWGVSDPHLTERRVLRVLNSRGIFRDMEWWTRGSHSLNSKKGQKQGDAGGWGEQGRWGKQLEQVLQFSMKNDSSCFCAPRRPVASRVLSLPTHWLFLVQVRAEFGVQWKLHWMDRAWCCCSCEGQGPGLRRFNKQPAHNKPVKKTSYSDK